MIRLTNDNIKWVKIDRELALLVKLLDPEEAEALIRFMSYSVLHPDHLDDYISEYAGNASDELLEAILHFSEEVKYSQRRLGIWRESGREGGKRTQQLRREESELATRSRAATEERNDKGTIRRDDQGREYYKP